MKRFSALLLLAVWSAVPARGAVQPDAATFRETVVPFLQKHCVECHGPQKPKANLSLHTIDGAAALGKDIEKWKAVAEMISLGDMPPEEKPRPNPHQAGAVLKWIKAELTRAGESFAEVEQKLRLPHHGNRVDHDALFDAGRKALASSPARLWRASPFIYSAFGQRVEKDARLGQPFSASTAEGFKDYADLFVIDEPTIAQLLRNARAIVDIQTAAKNGVKELMPLVDANKAPSDEEVKRALGKQFQIVLQRNPSAEELERFTALYRKNVTDSGQVIGARATLATVFLLPEALYRMELGQSEKDEHGRQMLAPRELAFAIGYALSDAGPDAALLKAAEQGKLKTAADVRREVDRLLKDPKFNKPRIMRFFDEYFEFPAAEDVFKDLNRGQWRPEILIRDTHQLIQYILDQDRDVLRQLLTTNLSFVNYVADPKAEGGARPARIANKKSDKPPDPKKPPKPRQMEYWDLYNLPADWEWTPKQPIKLDSSQRAGILTQPSWLAAYATNNETHTIRRGKWIRERLLGGVVPDLPITVDAQLPDAPEQTMRQRLAITQEAYCWQCHQKMNPLGLPFESYDYLGEYRKAEPVLDPIATEKNVDKKGQPLGPVMRDVPLDSAGSVDASGDPKIDGPVESAVQMIHRLAESPRVRQVFVRHAFRFWMGRNETLDDGPTLVAADQAYVQSGGSMKALITALLTSDSFLYRKAENRQE